MRPSVRVSIPALILLVCAALTSGIGLQAQSGPRLFDPPRSNARVPANARNHQARRAHLRFDVLNSPEFILNLFDNAERRVRRTKVEQPGRNAYVWHGRTDDNGFVTFAVVNGVATGTVFLDGRSFEITPADAGDYTVAELNAAAFPAEDESLPPADRGGNASGTTGESSSTGSATVTADGSTQIDVLVAWTPAARTAAGGTNAIQSLILSAVANANLTYANSLEHVQLRLVYSGELPFTETPTNMVGDLSLLRGNGDGSLDAVHSLRDQYGADVVTLIGQGYAGAGYCGLGYLMGSPSTSFASSAFNIVDRTCAAGYLSYAHEVGHNEGLHHDPGNATGTPSVLVRLRLSGSGWCVQDRVVVWVGHASAVPVEPVDPVQQSADGRLVAGQRAGPREHRRGRLGLPQCCGRDPDVQLHRVSVIAQLPVWRVISHRVGERTSGVQLERLVEPFLGLRDRRDIGFWKCHGHRLIERGRGAVGFGPRCGSHGQCRSVGVEPDAVVHLHRVARRAELPRLGRSPERGRLDDQRVRVGVFLARFMGNRDGVRVLDRHGGGFGAFELGLVTFRQRDHRRNHRDRQPGRREDEGRRQRQWPSQVTPWRASQWTLSRGVMSSSQVAFDWWPGG